MLGADGAAGAVLPDVISDQRLTRARWAPAFEMRLILFTEVAQRGQHRVWCGLAEAAQTALGHLRSQLLEFLQMRALGFAGAEEFEQFEHPLCADAAEGAFAARLV